jgi:hypothetical protein
MPFPQDAAAHSSLFVDQGALALAHTHTLPKGRRHAVRGDPFRSGAGEAFRQWTALLLNFSFYGPAVTGAKGVP